MLCIVSFLKQMCFHVFILPPLRCRAMPRIVGVFSQANSVGIPFAIIKLCRQMTLHSMSEWSHSFDCEYCVDVNRYHAGWFGGRGNLRLFRFGLEKGVLPVQRSVVSFINLILNHIRRTVPQKVICSLF